MRHPDPGDPGTGPGPVQRLDDLAELPETPLLENSCLILEPLRVAHAEVMVGLLSDPELYKYTGGSPPTEEQLRSQYERQVRGRSPRGDERWFNWVARENCSGEVVGYVQATVHQAREGLVAEVAWVIGAPYQGRGLAKSAAKMMKQWLCREGVHGFTAHVHLEHLASAAVATHLGLSPNGLLEGGEAVWTGTRKVP
ncbi:MAG: GNAT family N-acetyltransferase [Acidimicrobiales bacterium]